MTHEDRQGGRVTRLLVPAGIAAALVAGAVAYAGPASAVTPPVAPTLTLTMPAQVSNDGGPQNASLLVDNSAANTGTVPQTGESLQFVISNVPSGLSCTNIKLAGAAATAQNQDTVSFGAPTTGTGQCTWTLTTTPATQDVLTKVTYLFTIKVNTPTGVATPPTGSLSSQVNLVQAGPPSTYAAQSNVAPTQLVNPNGPVANSAAAPAAIVHQDYSFQLFTNNGFAKTTTSVMVYRVDDTQKTCTATPVAPDATPPANGDTVYTLTTTTIDGKTVAQFQFDATTGYVAASGSTLTSTMSAPTYHFVVVENNAVGGATKADATTCPPTAANDVRASFTPQVIFGDTAVNSLFGPAIYKLADNGVISGYGDGDFHGQYAVTRDQFAHFIALYAKLIPSDGPCTPDSPSAFTDVPNSSLFCKSIQALSNAGIVKGTGNDMFNPSGTILREQMAAFIYRTHEVVFLHVSPTNVIDPTCTSQPFPDVPTSNLFCGDIQWVSSNHIAAGYPNGDFHPTYGVARQEAAQFIYKLGVLENHNYA